MRYRELVADIGAAAARKLVTRRAGQRVRLPSVAEMQRFERDRRIVAALDRGATEAAAGRACGVSRRQVTRIAKRT